LYQKFFDSFAGPKTGIMPWRTIGRLHEASFQFHRSWARGRAQGSDVVIGKFEPHSQQVAKQLGESLTVCLGQWRFEQRGNILSQVLRTTRAEQYHMRTGFVPYKAIGRLCHTAGAAFVQ
jgi:hypothetical protein